MPLYTRIRSAAGRLLLLCLPLCTQGQGFPYREFTVADGLAHPLVFDITQDRNGFIYAATDNGLSRINGMSVTTIPIPAQKGAISLTSFSQPSDGSLLVSSSDNKRLFRIDRRGNISSLPIPQDILSPGMLITRFCQLRDRQYFIWDNRYRALYFADKDRIEKVNLGQGDRLPLLYRILERDGHVYIATAEGLFEYAGHQMKRIPVGEKEISWISLDPQGNLWAAGQRYLYCRQKGADTFTAYRHGIDRKINYCSVSSRGDVVIATYNELFLFRAADRQTKNITGRFDLQHIVITALFFDNRDNLWVGTYGHGLRCYYDLDALVYKTGSDFHGIFPKYFFALADKFLVCDGAQDYCVALGSDSLQRFPAPPGIREAINGIARYGQVMLVATKNDIFRYNNGQMRRLVSGGVSDFLWEADRAWIVAGNALYLVAPEQGAVRKIDFYANSHTGAVTRICRINGDLYAVATPDALYTVNIDPDGGSISSSKKIVSYPNATLLQYDPRRNLLVAGGKDGLCLVSSSSRTLLTTNDGLINNTINDVAFYKGSLLIGTLGGLNMYDLRTRRMFTVNKPFLKQEIISVNTWHDEVIIGTPSGIVRLKSPDMQPSERKFFLRSDTGMAAVSGLPAGSYSSCAGTETFRIEALDLSFENGPGLYYRVWPIEEAYKESPDGNIPLTRLPPGDYRMELAYARNGVVSSANTIPFHVSARWYQTTWGMLVIIALIALTAGGISYLVFRLLEQRRRRVHMIRDRIILLEIKALSALLHPHFIFNSLSSIHYLINQKNMEMVNRYLGKFSKLIRTNLETLYKGVNSLDDELEKIKLYLELEQLRFSGRFSYRIITDDAIRKSDFMIPVMLLQPFAENALLHGLTHMTGGEIIIRIRPARDPDELIVEIEDNGQGMHPAPHMEHGKSSLGIEIIRNRFTLLSRIYKKPFTITIEDKTRRAVPDTGTLVTLRIWNLTLQHKLTQQALFDDHLN